eukprot:1955139-Lingulodinium_polyedra.AAC.1
MAIRKRRRRTRARWRLPADRLAAGAALRPQPTLGQCAKRSIAPRTMQKKHTQNAEFRQRACLGQ